MTKHLSCTTVPSGARSWSCDGRGSPDNAEHVIFINWILVEQGGKMNIPFMEPFRIKSVEAIPFPDPSERRKALRAAGYNLFRVPARRICIDLLTDSGTGAMSDQQWSALMSGDESYAGASSFELFADTVTDITGFPEVIPVHQGRAAERILFSRLLSAGNISVSNTHFDTTR